MQGECLKFKAVNDLKEVATTKQNNFRLKVFSPISVRPAQITMAPPLFTTLIKNKGEKKEKQP